MIACYDPGFTVRRFKVQRGRPLVPGEESRTGVYLLCTTQCGTPLRASLDKEIAALHEDPSSRTLYEGILWERSSVGRAPGLMNREVAGSIPVGPTSHVTQSNGVEA